MKRKLKVTKKEINEVIADSAIRNRNLYIFFGGVCLFFLLAGLSTPEEAFLDLSKNGIEIPFAGIEFPYIFFYTAAPLLLLIVQGHLYLNLAKHRQRRKDNSYPELMAPFTFNFADKAPKHNDIRSLLFRILNYCVLSVLPILTFAILLFRITDYQDMTLILWYTITLVVSAILVVSFIPGWSKSPRNVCCIAIFSVVVMCIYIIIYSNYSQIVYSDYYCGENHFLYAIPVAKVFTPGKISLPFYHKDSNEYSYTNYAGRSFVCADFTEVDFSDQTFVGANFNKAQLNRIQLQGANLDFANLQGANLRGANLQGANLRDAQLQGVNLVDMKLQNATLANAKLQGTNLRGAQLQGVNLNDTNLQNFTLENAKLQGANLRNATLQRANLRFAKMQGATLVNAQLQGAYLWNAKLQGANLRNATLQGANLRIAQLQGVVLDSAKLQGADLGGANLKGADIKNAKLQGADLRDAQLQGANLENAKLQGANLGGAHLQGANLGRAQLQGTYLVSAQLQGASCKYYFTLHLFSPLKIGLSRIKEAVNTKLTVEDCINGTLSQDDIEKIMEEIPPSTQDIEISYFTIEKTTTIGNKIRQQLKRRENNTTDFTDAECGKLTKDMAKLLEDNWDQKIDILDGRERIFYDLFRGWVPAFGWVELPAQESC